MKPCIFFLAMVVVSILACNAPGQPSVAEKKEYEAEIKTWYASREATLKAPNGWLNLVGLFWLNPGSNSFGSDSAKQLVFPAGKIVSDAGYFELRGDTVRLHARPEAAVTIQGQLVRDAVLYPTITPSPVQVQCGSLRWTIIQRDSLLGVRLRDLDSKLLTNFRGIDHFPIDINYRVKARFEKADSQRSIAITNVLGQTKPEKSPGTLVFTLNGKECRLDVLVEKDDYFLIFADATTGQDSYAGGRFLYVKKAVGDEQLVVDFNKAINPPCVFTPYATCPLPPVQNRLPISVQAGEKKYGHDQQ